MPGIFPNVTQASLSKERDGLESRYQQALARAESRGTKAIVDDFELKTANTKAVLARSIPEVHRLATSENEIYATFYQLTEAGVKMPTGGKWDILRSVADQAVFPGYSKDLRFGALSLNELGLRSYGECSLVLSDNMIGHRATVFEKNSTRFFETNPMKMSEAHKMPEGYRALWAERGKLCVAKLADQMFTSTTISDFPKVLLKEGKKPDDNEFIEVNIWGPITSRAFEQVIVRRPKKRGDQLILHSLIEKLGKIGVRAQVI